MATEKITNKLENKLGVSPLDIFAIYKKDKDAVETVSAAAYGKCIPNLTEEECKQLEKLCDKAFDGYNQKLDEFVIEILREAK